MNYSFRYVTGKNLCENSVACDLPFNILLSFCGLYKIGSVLGSTVSCCFYALKNVPKMGTSISFNKFDFSDITREMWTQ